MFSPRQRVRLGLTVFGLHLLFSSCSGAQEQFVSGRIEDKCDGAWPVCSNFVGCLVGDQSYVTGRFPGTQGVGVQIFEPSNVKASLFLIDQAATGDTTTVTFYETSCRSNSQVTKSGKAVFDEFDAKAVVEFNADVTTVGDHLIEIFSDSKTKYLFKLDVIPLRLKK